LDDWLNVSPSNFQQKCADTDKIEKGCVDAGRTQLGRTFRMDMLDDMHEQETNGWWDYEMHRMHHDAFNRDHARNAKAKQCESQLVPGLTDQCEKSTTALHQDLSNKIKTCADRRRRAPSYSYRHYQRWGPMLRQNLSLQAAQGEGQDEDELSSGQFSPNACIKDNAGILFEQCVAATQNMKAKTDKCQSKSLLQTDASGDQILEIHAEADADSSRSDQLRELTAELEGSILCKIGL
jgi:hypothetical protein